MNITFIFKSVNSFILTHIANLLWWTSIYLDKFEQYDELCNRLNNYHYNILDYTLKLN